MRSLRAARVIFPIVSIVTGGACTGDHVTAPFESPPPAASAALALGTSFSCALNASGLAYCWGDNSAGQLGNGSYVGYASPREVEFGEQYSTISASDDAVCALVRNGSPICWGAIPGYAYLTRFTSSADPVGTLGPTPLVAIATGHQFACVLDRVGTSYCWGRNERGQLGVGDTATRRIPTRVVAPVSFVAIVAGFWHTCGLTSTGAAYCWGDDTWGELGDGTTGNALRPVPVGGGIAFRSLTGGSTYTCGVATSGVGYCWGGNFAGQLGDGTTDDRHMPTAIAGGFTLAVIRAARPNSTTTHTCALTTAGAVLCWGWNAAGEAGPAAGTSCAVGTIVAPCTLSPATVPNIGSATAIDVGGKHSCALTTVGALMCWGDNAAGELGDGNWISPTVPVMVAGGLRFP